MPEHELNHFSNDRIAHDRLGLPISDQKQVRPAERFSFGIYVNRIDLASVARVMHVSAAIATYPDESGKQRLAAYGFSTATDIGPFAAACDKLCSDRALVIPDIALHHTLIGFAGLLSKPDTRFLVGIALQNNRGQRVGSLAVVNSAKAVASRGISFRNLLALGKAFTETGRLDAELIAA